MSFLGGNPPTAPQRVADGGVGVVLVKSAHADLTNPCRSDPRHELTTTEAAMTLAGGDLLEAISLTNDRFVLGAGLGLLFC